MENLHQRKKEPEIVRKKILDTAISLAANKGVMGVSIQGVADIVGITKGGVFHHFSTKQKLLDAMLVAVFQKLNDVFDVHIQNDPVQSGQFTRAYIQITLSKEVEGMGNLWDAVSMTMLTDHSFNEHWIRWLDERLERHQNTDSDVNLSILRYAADGLWLTTFSDIEKPEEAAKLKAELIQRTYPK